jgi:hypothetical protein
MKSGSSVTNNYTAGGGGGVNYQLAGTPAGYLRFTNLYYPLMAFERGKRLSQNSVTSCHQRSHNLRIF